MEPLRPEQSEPQPVTWISTLIPDVLEEIEFHPSMPDVAAASGIRPARAILRRYFEEERIAVVSMNISDSFFFRARAAQQADERDESIESLTEVVYLLRDDLYSML